MTSIVCFGECMVELRSVQHGENERQIFQGFAGDVYNTCVYLKRIFGEVNVEFATQVGSDTLSQEMIEQFELEHIGHKFVTQDQTRSPGLYWITTDGVGERSFTYWRDNSAARFHMQEIDENVIAELAKHQWLFISGISLAVIQPHLRSVFWNMVKQLKSRGVKLIFDPNYRPKLWASPEETKEQYATAFELCDLALPGVEDMEALYQLTDVQQVMSFLSTFNIDELVVKNGSDNVFVFTPDGQVEVPIEAVTNVIDTTSAGDSFNGAYIGARMSEFSVSDAVRIASKVAGFVIQHPGAIVEKTEFNRFLSNLEALS